MVGRKDTENGRHFRSAEHSRMKGSGTYEPALTRPRADIQGDFIEGDVAGNTSAQSASLAETAVWGLNEEYGVKSASMGGDDDNKHDQNTTDESSSSSKVAKNSLVMGLGTLASRVLGLVRSPILLGAVVGMNYPVANSFDVANKLPTLIYMIVVGGLVNAVLVPAIVRATKESKDSGQAFINKLITIAIVFLGAITLALTLASPLVVKGFAATMSDDWYRVAVAFTYWCMPQVFFYGLYTVLGQILNARENFGPYMWAPVLNNVVAIAGLIVILHIFGTITDDTGRDASAWGFTRIAMLGGFSTLGIVAQALILIIPLYRMGIRYRPDFSWRGAGLGSAGRASWWMFLTMLVSVAPTMMWSNVASSVTDKADLLGINIQGAAGNYAHTTAYTIYTIPQSLIVVSIATAIFTSMARHAVNRDMTALRSELSSAVRTVSTLMFLCTALFIVLAAPISRLLSFTVSQPESLAVARVLIAMSLGIVGAGVQTIFNRIYYAFEDTKGNFLIILPFQIVQTIGYWACFFLPPLWSVVGVGVVQSLINTLVPLAMSFHLSKKMGGIDGKRLVKVHLQLFLVTFVSIAVGAFVLRLFGAFDAPFSFMGAIVRGLVVSPVVIGVFVGGMKLLRMEELGMMIAPIRSIGRKFGLGR